MSASREKKKRLDNGEGEATPVVQSKKGLGKTAKTVIGIVVAIALIAVIVFFGMISTSFFEKHTTAAEVNGHKLTPAMVNYYYTNELQKNQQILSMVTDPEKPLTEQPYITEEYANWGEYMMKSALDSAAEAYAIYDEAVEKGFTLSEESQKAIDDEIEMTNAMAPMYGAASGDALMASAYGKGCNMKTYKEFLTVGFVAQEYANSVLESLTYTQEEQDAYYAEHTNDLDGFNFRTYAILAEQDEDGKVTEETLKAAEEAAKAIAEAGKDGEEAYLEAVKADAETHNTDSEEPEEIDPNVMTLCEDYSTKSMDEATAAWLVDAARQEGDTVYLPNGYDNGFTAVYFIGRADHSYRLPTVRHALFAIDKEAADPEAAKAKAQADAEAALEEFLAGDATEEAFAEMASVKSADTGSAANGGLYEDITKGRMVPSFEEWCYDEARKPGDTGIVETEYGFHVMYFVDLGATLHDYLVENTMRSEDFNEWKTAATADAAVELVSDRFVATH